MFAGAAMLSCWPKERIRNVTDRVFVVVRGPALTGKSTLARALAERLTGKVALISEDDLRERWIVGHDDDFALETELVYRQLKLLTASYIRGGYHVVVDAMFAAYRDGAAALHDSDLRDLLGLVSTIRNVRPLLVNVSAPLAALLERATSNPPEADWDARAVESLSRAFESTFVAPVVIDTSLYPTSDAVDRVLGHLGVRV
jgi:predicted kinase